jgi:predicted nucleotidyltransferase
MDRITNEVKSIVDEYIRKLEENDIKIKKAILFGSQAGGFADEWSDIDIALVSENFEGVRYKDKEKIRKITLSVSSLLSPLPYSTKDFFEMDPFLEHIIATGVALR